MNDSPVVLESRLVFRQANAQELPLATREGKIVTVGGRSVQLMNDHEAGYLFEGIESAFRAVTEALA